jgi:hypothetical protein
MQGREGVGEGTCVGKEVCEPGSAAGQWVRCLAKQVQLLGGVFGHQCLQFWTDSRRPATRSAAPRNDALEAPYVWKAVQNSWCWAFFRGDGLSGYGSAGGKVVARGFRGRGGGARIWSAPVLGAMTQRVRNCL